LNVSNPLSLRDHARLSKKFFGEFDDRRPSALSRANNLYQGQIALTTRYLPHFQASLQAFSGTERLSTHIGVDNLILAVKSGKFA
jgi:hypothetical protein